MENNIYIKIMYFLLEDKNGKRFTFFHIAKTGGTSIRGHNVSKGGSFKVIEKSNTFIDSGSDFCFTIIRNPYERLISTYSDFSDKRDVVQNWDMFINMMKMPLGSPLCKDENVHKKIKIHTLQYTDDIEDMSRMKYIIDFNKYKEELQHMFTSEGIECINGKLPRLNVSLSSYHKIPNHYKEYVSTYLKNDVQHYEKSTGVKIEMEKYFGETNFYEISRQRKNVKNKSTTMMGIKPRQVISLSNIQ